MKLYYTPFACSLATHIMCRELGVPIELLRVDLAAKRVDDGSDYLAINPMGQVPTLVTDNGRVLTENVAVLAYLDRRPEPIELVRWLAFVGSELHKRLQILMPFYAAPDVAQDFARAQLVRPLAVLDAHLATRAALLGDDFTAADAYLVWTTFLLVQRQVTLPPHLAAHADRHRARPAVDAAFRFERDQRARLDASRARR
jgi:glutathione S-transferase